MQQGQSNAFGSVSQSVCLSVCQSVCLSVCQQKMLQADKQTNHTHTLHMHCTEAQQTACRVSIP